MDAMSLKLGLAILVISLTLGYELPSQAMNESSLLVKLVCKTAPELLDTEIVGSLVNKGSSPINVTLPSASFPFEVELLNKLGNDILAKHRKPSPTHRRAENATQTVHLEPGEKRSFTLTLRGYLESRGFPKDVDQAYQLRLLVAASTEDSGRFSVFRSNIVDLR
jgi:hypothetical protein